MPVFVLVKCCIEVIAGRAVPVAVHVYRHGHTSTGQLVIFRSVGGAVLGHSEL